MANEGQIFTTLGWLPVEKVEFRESVTHDDEYIRVVRVDKYVDGVWVGNDLNGTIKKGHDLILEQGQFS